MEKILYVLSKAHRRICGRMQRARATYLRYTGVRVGSGVRVDKQVHVTNRYRIYLDNKCYVGPYSHLQCGHSPTELHMPYLKIMSGAWLGAYTFIEANLSVIIGHDTLIAPFCYITDSGHRYDSPDRLIRDQEGEYAPVLIGSNVWIGTHCVILKGITVGDGAVIGANSTVTRDVPARTIVAGSPAKTIRAL